ncbi:MAG: TM0106 family RecB-like putative nuclease [Candidatus Eisenbacteria bacterium]
MIWASHLYQYISCPRWPRNEFHGDPRMKRGPSAFLKKLLADGVQHEAAIYADLRPERVSYPAGDHAAGAAETLRLMRVGVPLIAQAVLTSGRRVGVSDLLERRPGHSALGDYLYEPIEIKSARSVKPVYRIQLAFYGHLLADTIGAWPVSASVILVDGRREDFALETVRPEYERLLAGLEQVVDGAEVPVHISSTCGECPWEANCLVEARRTHDVSLTYGLQRRVAQALREQGIHTLEALAACDPPAVARWGALSLGQAMQLVIQAQVLVTGEARWRGVLQFANTEEELYFDIEGDPEHDVEYLFGVLTRRKDGSEDYRAFVAEQPGEEARAFGELLDYVEAHPDAPIYHYHHYERSAIKTLAERHRIAPVRAPAMLARMRDLHKDLATTAVLPVYSYSLKAVAKRLGARWTHPDASAAQSMFWYSTWLKTGERGLLELAVEYNADDCRATRRLKEWLAEGPGAAFLPQNDEPAA